jgi:hypothetical protein
MSATRASRAKFVAAILLLTGMITCPYLVVDRAEAWFQAISCDHDAAFLLEGITDEFRYDIVDPDPGGTFYRVPNYVPEEHASKASAWVQAETAAGIYAPITKAIARGFCGSWCRGQRSLGHGQSSNCARILSTDRYQYQSGNFYRASLSADSPGQF